jgi:hypothetical protein
MRAIGRTQTLEAAHWVENPPNASAKGGVLYLIWLEASDRIANAADFAHDDNEHFPVIVAP